MHIKQIKQFSYYTTLIFGGYLILAKLADKAKSAKIEVRQYLIFNTHTVDSRYLEVEGTL